MKRRLLDPPRRVEVDHDGLGEAVPALHEAADVARERVREHGHDPVGEIHRRAAEVGLQVERPPLAHVVRHVRDVHREAVAPVTPALDPDRVVVVAGRLGVDGDGEPAPEVGPAGHLVRPYRERHALRLLLHLRRERVGQAVLGDDDLEVDTGVGEVAQHLGDPPHGVAGGGGRPRHVRRDHLARDGAAFLAGRDEELVQHAAVERHHVAAEAPVDLVAAHDALVGALEDADDAALGPLGGAALDAGHDAVAVEGLAEVRRRHVEVGLALAPRLGHDEAEPAGIAGEATHDEVHAVRQPDVSAADLDEHAVGDQLPQDRRQLAPSGGVEGELARDVAHRHGLAEARHEVEHPAIETCCVVYRDSVMRMGGAGGGT